MPSANRPARLGSQALALGLRITEAVLLAQILEVQRLGALCLVRKLQLRRVMDLVQQRALNNVVANAHRKFGATREDL